MVGQSHGGGSGDGGGVRYGKLLLVALHGVDAPLLSHSQPGHDHVHSGSLRGIVSHQPYDRLEAGSQFRRHR